MAAKPLPDQALLLKLLRYDPETGKLFWRERTPELFSRLANNRDAWNARNAGKQVSPCPAPTGARGYCQMSIQGRKFLVHRIIWKMVTGEDPDQLDHINGDRTDNRFCNLRAVSCAENLRNLRRHGRNKSGCTGVFWNKDFNRWQAFISVGGKRKHLGLHINKDAAIHARKAAERRYGYHPNHGRASSARAKKKETPCPK